MAKGGTAGTRSGGQAGAGGVGRIRIEYCDTLSGSTNPPASVQKLNCYIAEQVESAPYDRARLNLPESFSDGRTYQVQYGRRLLFGAGGEQVTTLRVPAAAFTGATLDALLSEVGSGSFTFRLDIGNDGSWDWETTQSVDNAATLTSPSLAVPFSQYWAAHGAPTTGTLDVPVKVSFSKAGQVLLTNLRMTPTGSKARLVRLPARNYSNVTLSFTVSGGSGPLALGVDVGADGTVDWAYSGSPAWPAQLTTGNLAAAFNAYLAGKGGEVDVPLRFYLAPFADLALNSFSATPSAQPDLTLSAGDIAFGATSPTEGSTVPVTATVHNAGALDSGGVTALLLATAPGWGETYIGSCYIANVPAGSAASGSIPWNTLGFTGTVPIRVALDPYDRLAETNEGNNAAETVYDVLSRPDLRVEDIALSDDEPVVGQTVQVSVQLRNRGQTASAPAALELYRDNPDGALLGHQEAALPAQDATVLSFDWTPTTSGWQRLYALADVDADVNEFDESNNGRWRDIYVGFAGPIVLDSGGSSEPAYDPALGYGYLSGVPSDFCGEAPEQTQRRDAGGEVGYRFDHLLPGHYYHLDLLLQECDSAAREQAVAVDSVVLAPAIALGDQEPHRLSLLLDPALYADHTISVTVSAPGIDGAVVNSIALHDIEYAYIDAGGPGDEAYTAENGHGYLDGQAVSSWGTLPYRTVRVNQTGNVLRYRFDGLNPSKSYQVNLVFWQPSGSPRVQTVQIDGTDTGAQVNTGDYQVHELSVPVPRSSYIGDGSVVVSIARTGAATGAMVNEIALEELTLACGAPPPPCGDAVATSSYADIYGLSSTLDGDPVPVGSCILAFDPQGVNCGAAVVSSPGQYGIMHIYGDDPLTPSVDEGASYGDEIRFTIDGYPAQPNAPFLWVDKRVQQVELSAASAFRDISIPLGARWNLVSFNVDPIRGGQPVSAVPNVLEPITGYYDAVLGYDQGARSYYPDLGGFNDLQVLDYEHGYWLHLTAAATLELSGSPVEAAHPLDLYQGWNLVSYLPEKEISVPEALASIAGQYTAVLGFHADGARSYYPHLPPEINDLKCLKVHHGYWIKMSGARTLTYPETGTCSALAGGAEPTISAAGDVTPTHLWCDVYSLDTTYCGAPVPVGSVVEAYDPDGVLCGRFVVQQAGRWGVMHVYGDDPSTPEDEGAVAGDALTFTINGKPVEMDRAVTWQERGLREVNLHGDPCEARVVLPLILSSGGRNLDRQPSGRDR